MSMRVWAYVMAIVLGGCSESRAPRVGRVVVAVTVDWEGVAITPEAIDAVAQIRARGVPITHFVSAAYFTNGADTAKVVEAIRASIGPNDELAMHLHAWRSLVQASGVVPKLAPSFLTGTDKLIDFDHGDTGFDTDLDTYEVVDLRVMLRTSRRLLEQTTLPVSSSFRAGGYLGTPKLVRAIRAEGYTVDSSATHDRQFDTAYGLLGARVDELWPKIEPTTQPFLLDDPLAPIVEMPIAAIVDNVTAAGVVEAVERAHTLLDQAPDRDVFFVVGFHLETAPEHAPRLGQALDRVLGQPDLAGKVTFTTITEAAYLAKAALAPAAR